MLNARVASEPWRVDVVDVAERLGTDVARGLSASEAAARLARDGPNRLDAAARVPEWRKFLAQFADPLVGLLMGAVVVSLIAWLLESRDELPFEVVVISAIVNAVLGYVQAARAEHAVAALQRRTAATAGVLRDGRQERVPAAYVVVGDGFVGGRG